MENDSERNTDHDDARGIIPMLTALSIAVALVFIWAGLRAI
jgi:hypothetical protein